MSAIVILWPSYAVKALGTKLEKLHVLLVYQGNYFSHAAHLPRKSCSHVNCCRNSNRSYITSPSLPELDNISILPTHPSFRCLNLAFPILSSFHFLFYIIDPSKVSTYPWHINLAASIVGLCGPPLDCKPTLTEVCIRIDNLAEHIRRTLTSSAPFLHQFLVDL